MLTIETSIESRKPQAEEITNIFLQYKNLLKKPDGKLRNFFLFCPLAMAFSLVVIAVLGVLMATGHTKSQALDWVTIFAMFFLFFFSVLIFRSARKFRDTLMEHKGSVTIVFDEEGIDYDDHNGKKLKAGWNTFLFLREFKECIAFLPKESTGNGIFLERNEFNKIVEYMDEIGVDVPVIRRED